MILLSIDLAADERNTTGIALLNGNRMTTLSVLTDGDIIGLVRKHRPDLIGIDAPLSLPHGRKSIDERDTNHFRECDLQLRELGIRFFPITIGGMRRLTKRGMALKGKLEKLGFEVVEIFPGASFDILGLERKNVEATNRFLKCRAGNVHESDAAIGAYTLKLYKKGKARLLSGRDGAILVPG
jgi:predicted nuclease with RNAse H fold